MLNHRWLDASMEFRFSATDQGLHLKRVHDTYLGATLLAAGLSAACRADGQYVRGFDGDLYPLMIRIFASLQPLPGLHLVLESDPSRLRFSVGRGPTGSTMP